MELTRRAITLILATLLAGCHLIDKRINETWPPKSGFDKQYDATLKSVGDLQGLGGANTYLTLKRSDWAPALERLLLTSAPQISKVSMDFGEQEIVANVEFSGTVPLDNGKDASLAGRASIVLAPSFDGSTLYVDPWFARIELTRGYYFGWELPPDIVQLVNGALNRLIANINGTIGKYAFQVDTGLFQQFDPMTLAQGDRNVRSAYGNPIKIETKVATASLLVDPTGVNVLARMTAAHPKRIASALAKVGGITTAQAESDEDLLALAAMCPDYLKMPLSPAVKPVHDACNALRAKARSSTIRPMARASEDDFQKLYKEFRKNFLATTATTMGFESVAQTGLAVSKQFLANAINVSSSEAEFGLTYDAERSTMPFDDTLRTESAPDLKCSEIAANCPSVSCPTPGGRCDYSCSSGRGCPGSCDWWDVGCQGWKVTCEILKAGEIVGCNAGKGVCIATCLAELGAKRLACEAEAEAKKIGCRINQEWLNLWADRNIGNIKGSVTVQDAELLFQVKGRGVNAPALQVADDFSRFTINGAASASGSVHANFQYTPLDLGHILCVAQWQGGIQAHVAAAQTNYGISGTIEAKTVDDNLQLWVVGNPLDVTLALSPPPIVALFSQNPQAAIACAPALILGISVHLFGEIKGLLNRKQNETSLLKDTFKIQIQSLKSPIVIPPIVINFPPDPSGQARAIKAFPDWGTRNLMFTTRSAN
jgi:hypothetical protein